MSAGVVVAIVFGAVVSFVGFVFWLITRFMRTGGMDRETTGQVVDMTRNAYQFNLDQGQTAEPRAPRVRVQVRATGLSGFTLYFHKVYTYTVGGVTYTRADMVQYSRNLAQRAIGKEVTVYYDSADPGISCLGGGNAFVIVYRILFGIGFALLALAACLWLL